MMMGIESHAINSDKQFHLSGLEIRRKKHPHHALLDEQLTVIGRLENARKMIKKGLVD